MKQIIIIGNSAAGISAAEAIRNKDREVKITIISDEDYLGYCRCLLSYYLAGEIKEERLLYRDKNFYEQNRIELLLNKKVISVNTKTNQVILEDKQRLTYDYLIIASGASSNFPEIKGIKKEGVFGLRTIADVRKILEQLALVHTVCVLGGGLIGLKSAYALHKRQKEIKVIIKSKQVFSQVLDQRAAEMFKERFQEQGVEIITERDCIEILGNGDCKAIKLDTGKVLASELVMVGKGVVPNIKIVEETAIKINEGILVDEYLRTNIENIFACGDVAECFDSTLGRPIVNALWPNAIEQGRVAGLNVLDSKIKYDGSQGMNSAEFFGLPFISMGITRVPSDTGFEEFAVKDFKNNIYKKLVLKDNLIKGAIFVGSLTNSGVFLRLIRERVDVSSILDTLLSPTFSYADIKNIVEKEDEIYLSK